MPSTTLLILLAAAGGGMVCSCLLAFFASTHALADYTFLFAIVVSFMRLWIQECLQRSLENESPRFRALPPLLQRHDASLICRLVVFAFSLPATFYFVAVVVVNPNAIVEIYPGVKIASLLVAMLAIIDLTQRKSLDWRLHVHHFVLCGMAVALVDSNFKYKEAGVIIFSFYSTMDEPVWVLWSLDHLRRQREKEPAQDRKFNDSVEVFPPPTMYEHAALRKLHLMGLLHYVIVARGTTAVLLAVYMAQSYDGILLGWKVLLPVAFVLFVVIDMDVVLLLYRYAKTKPTSPSNQECSCQSWLALMKQKIVDTVSLPLPLLPALLDLVRATHVFVVI